jgi:hypothetical protein
MLTDMVKLLAIVLCLTYPQNLRSHFALPASNTSSPVAQPYAGCSIEKLHSLPLLPPGRCHVTVVEFLDVIYAMVRSMGALTVLFWR